MKPAFAAVLGGLLFATSGAPLTAGEGAPAGIEEPSGVFRQGDDLLIVSDDTAGTTYRLPIEEVTGRLPFDMEHVRIETLEGGRWATDLEAIAVLADGRVVVLSEDLAALLDRSGIVAKYPPPLAEFGGRGLEGLAVRSLPDGSSRVAILWEGGYPHGELLPGEAEELGSRSFRPLLVVHDLAPGESDLFLDPSRTLVWQPLNVPRPAGEEPAAQRFRAPDLVWHSWEANGETVWGFIVLLSSESDAPPGAGAAADCPHSPGERYCYKWLLRFGLDGEPVGDPLDLREVTGDDIRDANWEGLAWFEPGRRLVLVYDEKVEDRRVDPQVAAIVDLPADW